MAHVKGTLASFPCIEADENDGSERAAHRINFLGTYLQNGPDSVKAQQNSFTSRKELIEIQASSEPFTNASDAL
jgi:hypothetical protein